MINLVALQLWGSVGCFAAGSALAADAAMAVGDAGSSVGDSVSSGYLLAQTPPRSPFYLNAEKRELQGDLDETGKNPNRLQRGTAVQDVPPVAPKLQSGVEDRGGNFNLKVEDWALPANVNKNAPLQSQTALPGTANRAPLRGQASIQLLSDFDVELIVDESLSMRRRDCPGGLSRWEWCGMQLRDLSNRLAPLVPRGFTLTTFNGLHKVYPNAKPKDVNDLFDNPFFMPGTRLSRPLTDRLQSYFDNRRPGSKPLLIVVITDGVPAPKTEPYMVAQTLVTASKIMKDPKEVTVVFFQIGGTDGFRGRAFLSDMDNNLVNNGARFDFVKTVSFEQLQQGGLTTALINTIKDAHRRTNLSTK
ncbi:MAG: hypothetical protein SGJ27_01705 [Candidatus Melainabacteria bacterium]|nr:hypothetical protein [Candidatus Melainabacteria bacterium]